MTCLELHVIILYDFLDRAVLAVQAHLARPVRREPKASRVVVAADSSAGLQVPKAMLDLLVDQVSMDETVNQVLPALLAFLVLLALINTSPLYQDLQVHPDRLVLLEFPEAVANQVRIFSALFTYLYHS